MVLAATLAIIVGWLRGGRLGNLANLAFPLWWLIIIASLVQASFPLVIDRIDDRLIFLMYLLSFLSIAVALAANVRKRYVAVVLVGVLMNLLVIMLNQGMPFYTDVKYSRISVQKAVTGLHVPASSKTLLGGLADWIAIPPPYPQPALFSPGDIVISIGLFLFIQYSMRKPVCQVPA